MNSFKFQVSSFKFQVVNRKSQIVNRLYLLLLVILFSCQQNYVPKPHAYYRIDFPDKEYRLYDSICPFKFEYPVYGKLLPDTRPTSEPCWFNVSFPKYRGTVYLSYIKINNDINRLIEENWTMLSKGAVPKADAIIPHEHAYPERNVYGTIYDIKGNAAYSVQFFVTDSVKNFLRGSLYFYTKPNQDSLAPVISFFREDIIHLMKTIQWKEENRKIINNQ